MKKATLLYFSIVFLFLFLFFIVFHPIAIFDTDDWSFIHHLRLPIPVIHAWNPIKVFPEVLMSFFSYLGAYTLYPLTGRYCFSLSISNGIFICFMLTVYFVEFFFLIDQRFNLKQTTTILISTIFIGLHFLIVAHIGNDNIYLFYAYDMTCIYHYILSTVVNASLVMHLIRYDGLRNFASLSIKHRLLIAVWIYFSIFSSLYTNIIIAVYVGVELLITLINDCSSGSFILPVYFKSNKAFLIPLIIWFCSLAIESTGGRSSGRESNFISSLYEAFINLWKWFGDFSLYFLLMSGGIITIWFVTIKNKNLISTVKYLLALFFTTLYILLLSAVVDSSYVRRVDVFFAAFFWVLLILMLALCSIAESIHIANAMITALALFSIIGTIYVSNTCKEINYINMPYEQCEALVDDIIAQFKAAEMDGKTEFNLLVPAFDGESNWPIGTFAASHFTKVMYRHRIVHTKIDVIVMPSEEKSREFIR